MAAKGQQQHGAWLYLGFVLGFQFVVAKGQQQHGAYLYLGFIFRVLVWLLKGSSSSMVTAGYFPDHTLTEDYALGMEMRRTGWREVYVEDELVRGSAPDKVRGAFGQRSRWCKVGFFPL